MPPPTQRRKPSRRLVVTLLGLACGALARPPHVRADAAPPRAVVAEREQKLGVIAQGVPAVATFRIENAGVEPLRLEPKNPQPFVAGVHTEVQGAPVAAGATATITVTLDTGGVAGVGTVHVPVETNDPNEPRIVLGVTVEVKPFLAADPAALRFNVVQHEREGTIAQTVLAADGATFRVLAVESPNEKLRVSFHEAGAAERRDAPGSQWRIESTLASDAPVGALGGAIVVSTDHPKQQRLRIPVSGFVRPVVAVTPPEADLGEVDGTKPFRFALDVKSFATEEIALERAETTLPGATVEIVVVKPGRHSTVRVSMPAGVAAGPLGGVVRIFTASAKAPVVEVPVRGRIRSTSAAADGK